jgi:hypothetical protein
MCMLKNVCDKNGDRGQRYLGRDWISSNSCCENILTIPTPMMSSAHMNTIILILVPCIFYYFVLWPTYAQLFHKLSHSYMFQHYCVILRELAINNLPSYTRCYCSVGLIHTIASTYRLNTWPKHSVHENCSNKIISVHFIVNRTILMF